MEPAFVIAGKLTREYLLPPVGSPRLDAPGGDLLYAAGGLAVWERSIGLLARVGEDYPRRWLREFEAQGLDTRGIRILPEVHDLRAFLAYSDSFEVSRANPVSHFARRQLTFPKTLLGYQPAPEPKTDHRQPDGLSASKPAGLSASKPAGLSASKPDPLAPGIGDIPQDYLDCRAAHLCPLDFASQERLLTIFRTGSATVLTLDASPGYMIPAFLKDLRALLKDLTAFLPSLEELQALFWGQTNDPWEMAAALGEYGCQFIVIKCGGRGQLLYDAVGKRRWEAPAYPARLADPTGAGAAFCGGFLAGYSRNHDPLEGVLHGNISASLKVEGSGAFYPLEVLPGLAQARLAALQELVREI